MDWAAENGHLEVVVWLHKNRSEGYTPWAKYWATEKGQSHMVKWFNDIKNGKSEF